MIKENQRILNQINVITDGLSVFCTLLLAFWVRFYLLPGGEISVPFRAYVALGLILIPLYLFSYASFGLYESFRRKRLYQELGRLLTVNALDMLLLQTFLFVFKEVHFSRWTLIIFFLLNTSALGCKRVLLRMLLRHYRQKGYNLKHVLIVGTGPMARRYLDKIRTNKELGYQAMGYVSDDTEGWRGLVYLGGYQELDGILKKFSPDEVVAAIPSEDYTKTPLVIAACEKAGVKLSIIPFYAEYMPTNPEFDDLDGLPLLNIRHIPLDNWGNAFIKRAMDIAGSLILIILTSPIMLIAAIGVRLSSPGPIIFSQERVGRNKKTFRMYKFRSMRVNDREDTGWSRDKDDRKTAFGAFIRKCSIDELRNKKTFRMYKFRSMRVNDREDTGWSRDKDDRKTAFGAFIRKCSIDELPQFFNVLKGDMSLVGPRPEVPFYVEQFREEVPLYMVKHQVRPGITGWAQVNGLRGDTSIKARIEHDIYYIEHWTVFFDIEILFMTLFKGIVNSEKLH